MLVLTRSKGQKIMIGNDIILTVVEVNGDQVRLGIEAPPNVAVYREEIYRSIKEQNEIAAMENLSIEEWKEISISIKKR